MYSEVKLSKEQAREIAYDLYDFIIQGIKEKEEKGESHEQRQLEEKTNAWKKEVLRMYSEYFMWEIMN